MADLLKEEELIKARAREYGTIVGTGVGTTLGSFLGVAVADDTLPITVMTAAGLAAGTTGGVLGRAIGAIGGRGVAALHILVRRMTCPQNQALAKDIAFYIKVNKRLKELRDGLQE